MELLELDGHVVGLAQQKISGAEPNARIVDQVLALQRKISSIVPTGNDIEVKNQAECYITSLLNLAKCVSE